MKKEKTVRAYQRRTKSGKIVTVKQHTAKYDAAEALKEAAKKKGAGEELDKLKGKAKESVSQDDSLGFTADDFKKWYHWDPVDDPKNTTALKVEKALKAKMGAKGYKKFFDEMTDSYSARGHNKAFKSLDSYKENSPKTPAKSSESSLKVGSTVRMGNSEFTTNDRDSAASSRGTLWGQLHKAKAAGELKTADSLVKKLSTKKAVRKLPTNMAYYYQYALGGKDLSETTARKVLAAMPNKYYKDFLREFEEQGGSKMKRKSLI